MVLVGMRASLTAPDRLGTVVSLGFMAESACGAWSCSAANRTQWDLPTCQAAPDDARLLCALGDLTVDDACYERAWAASGGRSVRAQRSLARSAQRRKDFAAVRAPLQDVPHNLMQSQCVLFFGMTHADVCTRISRRF